MQLTARRPKIMVSADGTGIVSQAGGLLLAQTLRATGALKAIRAALGKAGPDTAADHIEATRLALGSRCQGMPGGRR